MKKGKQPPIFYYRDKDGKEPDLLFVRDRSPRPVEIKKSSAARRDWAGQFSVLDRLRPHWTAGGFVGLARERLPLKENVSVIPVGLI